MGSPCPVVTHRRFPCLSRGGCRSSKASWTLKGIDRRAEALGWAQDQVPRDRFAAQLCSALGSTKSRVSDLVLESSGRWWIYPRKTRRALSALKTLSPRRRKCRASTHLPTATPSAHTGYSGRQLDSRLRCCLPASSSRGHCVKAPGRFHGFECQPGGGWCTPVGRRGPRHVTRLCAAAQSACSSAAVCLPLPRRRRCNACRPR